MGSGFGASMDTKLQTTPWPSYRTAEVSTKETKSSWKKTEKIITSA
jgi:hypothetical protein